MENINNKMDSTLMVTVPATLNLTDMVPQKEQAVDTSEERQKLSLLNVDTNTLMESIVPKEERSVAYADEDAMLAKAREMGLLSPVADMARIISSLSDKIYAIIRTDEKGSRFFEYCQQYEDGSFSPKMRVSQANLFLLANYQFLIKNIPDQKLRNRAANFLTSSIEDYLGKTTGEEMLDVTQILQLLFMARAELPVDKNASTQISPSEFYRNIMKAAQTLGHYEFARRAYYPFNEDEIIYIARELGMKKQELLKKLKENNFLYLTKSSRGYQTCVRFKYTPEELEEYPGESSYTEWRYCVFRFDNLTEEDKNNK